MSASSSGQPSPDPASGAESGQPPPAPPRLARRAITSLFDQAWLSLLNLVLGLVLIRLTSKDAYGSYAQLYVAGLFLTSMTEALISNPLTTLAAGSTPSRRDELVAHMSRFQGLLSTATAVVFGLGAAAVAHYAGLGGALWLGLAFACYAKTNAMREYRRSVTFLHHQPGRVLRLDLVYGILLAAGTTFLVAEGWLTVPAVFLVLAAANLVALLRQPRLPVSRDEAGYRDAIASMWRRGRLGVAGAALAWGVNYSYLYIGAAWLGVAASADLNASRLLLMPISLSVVAWSRVARPTLGVYLVRDEWPALRRLIRWSVAAILFITAGYAAALWWSLPWLQIHVLGDKYHNAAPLVAAWGVYFAVSSVRWIYGSVLVAQDRYAYLLVVSGVTVVTLLGTIVFAIPRYGTLGAVLTLIVVEAVSLALIWTAYRSTANRKAA